MSDKFLSAPSTGSFSGADITDALESGTTNLNVQSSIIQSLTPNRPLKTSINKQLISSELDIADTIGLQAELDKIRILDDMTTANDRLWSSAKIAGEVASSNTLQTAYDNGNAIATTLAIGPVTLGHAGLVDEEKQQVLEVKTQAGTTTVSISAGGEIACTKVFSQTTTDLRNELDTEVIDRIAAIDAHTLQVSYDKGDPIPGANIITTTPTLGPIQLRHFGPDEEKQSVLEVKTQAGQTTAILTAGGELACTKINSTTTTDLRTDLDDFIATKGNLSGLASLDALGKVPSGQIPDLAITQVYVVASEALRDAIPLVQQGDTAIVSSPPNNWIWTGPEGSPTASGVAPDYSWVKLVVPTGTVTSVNTQSGTVNLVTSDIPEGIEAPSDRRWYTTLREGEVFKKDGSVAMTGNLNMGANEITNATQIISGTVRTSTLASTVPSINVTSALDMNGVNIFMNGNSISDAGTVSCDTLSSATATNINVNHDLVMASGEFVYTNGLIGLPGPSPIIQIGSDLVMGSKKVIASDYTLDSTGLSSTSNLDIVANVGPSSITLDSNTAVSIPNCNLNMVGRQINECSVLDNGGGPMTVQSFGPLTLKTNSGGDVNIEPVQKCVITAPNNLWVNGIQQDTNPNAFMGRHLFIGDDVVVAGLQIDPILPEGVVFNMTPLAGNATLHRVNVSGIYKITFTSTLITTLNSVQAFVQVFRDGVELARNRTDPQKDIRKEFSLTIIDPNPAVAGVTTYQILLNSVGTYNAEFVQVSYERLGLSGF